MSNIQLPITVDEILKDWDKSVAMPGINPTFLCGNLGPHLIEKKQRKKEWMDIFGKNNELALVLGLLSLKLEELILHYH